MVIILSKLTLKYKIWTKKHSNINIRKYLMDMHVQE